MPGAFVTVVEILRVPGEELPHNAGDAEFAALEEKVCVIVHKDPRVHGALSVHDVLAESFKKMGFVLIVLEYVCFIVPAHHDMVQGASYVEAGLARHGNVTANRTPLIKKKDTPRYCRPQDVHHA